jgi:hypothetical protein
LCIDLVFSCKKNTKSPFYRKKYFFSQNRPLKVSKYGEFSPDLNSQGTIQKKRREKKDKPKKRFFQKISPIDRYTYIECELNMFKANRQSWVIPFPYSTIPNRLGESWRNNIEYIAKASELERGTAVLTDCPHVSGNC